jgi:hypothetical protein
MSSRRRSRISCRRLTSMMPVQMGEVDFTAIRRTTVARAGAKSHNRIKFTGRPFLLASPLCHEPCSYLTGYISPYPDNDRLRPDRQRPRSSLA